MGFFSFPAEKYSRRECPPKPDFCRIGQCVSGQYVCEQWFQCKDGDTCLNGAHCQTNGNSTKCINCDGNRFTGPRCNQCVQLHCEHGGHCVYANSVEHTPSHTLIMPLPSAISSTSSSNIGKNADKTWSFGNDSIAMCVCPSGHHGSRCEQSLCDGHCVNGTCRLQNGQPVCSCRPGYEGSRCEQRQCPFLCLNGGRCVRTDDRFLCLCPAGYAGSHCEVDRCSCLNGGRCTFTSSQRLQLYCSCPDHLNGTRCENLTATSCDQVNCRNGGKCKLIGSNRKTPVCDCPTEWKGLLCENPAQDLCENHCANEAICILSDGHAICL